MFINQYSILRDVPKASENAAVESWCYELFVDCKI